MKEAGYTSDVFGIKKNRKSFNEPGGFIQMRQQMKGVKPDLVESDDE